MMFQTHNNHCLEKHSNQIKHYLVFTKAMSLEQRLWWHGFVNTCQHI